MGVFEGVSRFDDYGYLITLRSAGSGIVWHLPRVWLGILTIFYIATLLSYIVYNSTKRTTKMYMKHSVCINFKLAREVALKGCDDSQNEDYSTYNTINDKLIESLIGIYLLMHSAPRTLKGSLIIQMPRHTAR
jgi:hypothetical protein